MKRERIDVKEFYNDPNITCKHLLTEKDRKDKWYIGIGELITKQMILSHIPKKKRNVHYMARRIGSELELEDYIARKYGRYVLLKYDIKTHTTKLEHDQYLIDLVGRMLNNKRNHDVAKHIVGHSWNIDIDMYSKLHMHLFLFINPVWLTGHYETDKYLFRENIIDLNRWIIKLVRTDHPLIKDSIINIPDDDWKLVHYLAYVNDFDSRNNAREWLSYNGKIDEYLYENNELRWYGRSQIKSDIIDSGL